MKVVARFIPLPVISAAIIGCAALGLAGTANAAETVTKQGTDISITTSPDVYAPPAPNAQPHHHHFNRSYVMM